MTARFVYADVRTEEVPLADLVTACPPGGFYVALERKALKADGIETPGTLWEREEERCHDAWFRETISRLGLALS